MRFLHTIFRMFVLPIATVLLLLLIAAALIEGPALQPFLYAVF